MGPSGDKCGGSSSATGGGLAAAPGDPAHRPMPDDLRRGICAKCTGHGPRPRQHAVRALAVASGHGCEISILREHGTVGSGDRRLCQSGGSVDRWDRCEGGAAAACAAWHANYALEAQARQLGWSASAQALNPRSLARACPPTTSHEPQPRELGACRHKGHQPAQPPVPRHSRCKYGTPTAWV
jgi:hypothetical protein